MEKISKNIEHEVLMREKAHLILRLNAQVVINDIEGTKETSERLNQLRRVEVEMHNNNKQAKNI